MVGRGIKGLGTLKTAFLSESLLSLKGHIPFLLNTRKSCSKDLLTMGYLMKLSHLLSGVLEGK